MVYPPIENSKYPGHRPSQNSLWFALNEGFKIDMLFVHADSENFDQSGWMFCDILNYFL